MQLTISDLFATPDHFLFAFDGDHALFADMDREAYARSIFLDGRIAPASARRLRVPVAPLLARPAGQSSAPIGWIFHVAHCGSTLLARALDIPGHALVLREPLALRQLGVEGASRPAFDWRGRLDLAVTLMARRYRPAAPVIVKANVPVNFIVPELMAMAREAPAIFLYFTLDDYLLAILRTDNHRKWVEGMIREVRPAIEREVGTLEVSSHAEMAAALWLAQLRIYAAALDRHELARSLDAELLFAEPARAVDASAALFGVSQGSVVGSKAARSDLFSSYSKNPQIPFDNRRRAERREETRRALTSDLAVARRWIDARLPTHPLPHALTKPLVGESPALLGA